MAPSLSRHTPPREDESVDAPREAALPGRAPERNGFPPGGRLISPLRMDVVDTDASRVEEEKKKKKKKKNKNKNKNKKAHAAC
ncbi:hypothetical protein EYF80_039836 [Liparis tanakae]|uniref:Uncharacterized protein n=1 Tax=Liparis tanakae TaxID=230148 RepID=A0A4Z2G8Y1_9TELE|nr:hypothetical protein EYF80_039836 [Liparis tanakae]